MKLTVIYQPDPLVTSQDEFVRSGLALDGSDRDVLVDALLLAGQSELDGPKGWVGISVAPQSLELRVDDFSETIRLLAGPIVGDPTVIYLASADGAETTLPTTNYVLLSDGTLQLASGQSWPALSNQGEAVRILYDVGIEDDADPRIQQMKTAIMMHAKMSLDFDEPTNRRMVLESLVRSMWVPVA